MHLFGSPNHYVPKPAWRDHICGLYYTVPCNGYLQKTYLPQVELQAHAMILATTSRTVLTQTFVNPSTEKGIKEVRYVFPLYDGVSVVGFTCHVGDRTIHGEVKEKEKARAVFQEAVARGETAGLLEQLPEASDVFTTTVGNIPPGARVIIKITYLGELKHDMEVDGIRFTIPNVICPRYGSYPGDLRTSSATDAMSSSISITVDAEMAEGSSIQKLQSPSHPIAMTMGTTSFAPNAEPTMTKASATLALGSAQLDTDFVLQIVAKNTGVPKAMLENHPSIPNHRALMATLVPKFALPAEKPEIVFVCDRSGSMAGSRMNLVVQALKVFLKSLPIGVKFNICSFGSTHSFLWEKSVTYSQKTLDEAIRHAEGFSANFGGTEMLTPLKATIEMRYKDMPLEVMMLTDGETWNQDALFEYLNQSVTQSKAPIRIFTLGIGNGVSHALIEGIAKAGNGFSQTVGEGEKMDTKVVRMLKGALSPHVNDYTLEVKYMKNVSTSEEEEGFEIVEKVADSLKVKLDLGDKKDEKKKTVGFQSNAIRAFFTNPSQQKPISLFDETADPDKQDPPAYDETGEERYAHLPKVPVPKVLQAPQSIPSLFAFNRTTVYLLLGPDASQATPKSLMLRGTSTHGPLELEIPIQILDLPGETIHQLAAKKAISELEQGRGWLPEAKTENDTLIRTKFEGRFEDMVEREAVRLGVQFQVGGKWCSFVAVESNRKHVEEKEGGAQGWEWLEDEAPQSSESQQCMSSRYQLSDSEESEEGDELEPGLGTCSSATERLHTLSKRMGQDTEAQNASISRITYKSANVKTTVTRDRKSMTPLTSQPLTSSQVQGEVDGTVQLLQNNIGKITERGERLDNLMAKSAPRSSSARMFKAPVKKQSSGVFGGLFGSSKLTSQVIPPAATFSTASASATSGYTPPKRRTGRGGGSGYSASGGRGNGVFSSYSGDSNRQPPSSLTPPLLKARSRSSAEPAAVYGGNNRSPSLFGAVAPTPGGAAQSQQGNHSLQDYQMLLMLNEQQNKKRLLMARQEQDTSGSTAMPYSPGAPFQQLAAPGIQAATAPPVYGAAPASANGRVSQSLSFGSGSNIDTFENFDFDSFLAADDKMDIDFEHNDESTQSIRQSTLPPIKTPEELLHYLISLQTFEGSWEWSTALITTLNLNSALLRNEIAAGVHKKHLTTAIVIAVLEDKLRSFQGSWELVVEKAREWLDNEVGDAENLLERARKVNQLKGNGAVDINIESLFERAAHGT